MGRLDCGPNIELEVEDSKSNTLGGFRRHPEPQELVFPAVRISLAGWIVDAIPR